MSKKKSPEYRQNFKEWVEGRKEPTRNVKEPVYLEADIPRSSAKKMKIGAVVFVAVLAFGVAFWFLGDNAADQNQVSDGEESGSEQLKLAIPPDTGHESSADESSVESTIVIKETETGWLNVRSGPSVANAVLSKVLPGETFLFTDKEGEWYKIQLSDEREGWVYGFYVNEIE